MEAGRWSRRVVARGAKIVIVRYIEATSSFPADVASAGQARAFVRSTLEAWQADQFVDRAVLAVSELVTNAVLHARSGPQVVVRLSAGRLRIEVHDTSPTAPSRKRYGLEAGTGRGLLMVEALSAAWGCAVEPDGKSVWIELDEADGTATPAPALGADAVADLEGLADLATSGRRPAERGPGRSAPRQRNRSRPSGIRPFRTRSRAAAR